MILDKPEDECVEGRWIPGVLSAVGLVNEVSPMVPPDTGGTGCKMS